jgi:tetratricopeptide (TPR) repeat protein
MFFMENALKKAVALAGRGRFEAAIEIFEKEKELAPLTLSYYALALCAARGEFDKAIVLCAKAAKKEFFNPLIYLNAGRIYILKGRKDLAVKAFLKGLKFDPASRAIIMEVKKLGIRRPRPLKFLPRSHPLNKMLGKFTYAGKAKSHA